MLIKCNKNDILRYEELIKPLLCEAVSSDLNRCYLNILDNFLLGICQLWVFEKDGQLGALLATTLNFDSLTKEKNFLLYALKSYIPLTQRDYAESFIILKRYAKSQGCIKLLAYSKIQKVIEMFKVIGGNTDYHLLQYSLED